MRQFIGLSVNRVVLSAVLIAVVPTEGRAQSSSGDRQPLAEEVFKNVQVLKGIPVSEFRDPNARIYLRTKGSRKAGESTA